MQHPRELSVRFQLSLHTIILNLVTIVSSLAHDLVLEQVGVSTAEGAVQQRLAVGAVEAPIRTVKLLQYFCIDFLSEEARECAEIRCSRHCKRLEGSERC